MGVGGNIFHMLHLLSLSLFCTLSHHAPFPDNPIHPLPSTAVIIAALFLVLDGFTFTRRVYIPLNSSHHASSNPHHATYSSHHASSNPHPATYTYPTIMVYGFPNLAALLLVLDGFTFDGFTFTRRVYIPIAWNIYNSISFVTLQRVYSMKYR